MTFLLALLMVLVAGAAPLAITGDGVTTVEIPEYVNGHPRPEPVGHCVLIKSDSVQKLDLDRSRGLTVDNGATWRLECWRDAGSIAQPSLDISAALRLLNQAGNPLGEKCAAEWASTRIRAVLTVDAQGRPQAGAPRAPPPDLKTAIDSLQFGEGSAVGASTNRSAAPELVTDTLEILAEIAYDKAKNRSYEIVRDRIEDLVCNEAEIKEEIDFYLEYKDIHGQKKNVHLKVPKGHVLPATCEVVRRTDLISLANAPTNLATAMRSDLVGFAVRLGMGLQDGSNIDPQLREDIESLTQILLEVLMDPLLRNEAPDRLDAQRLLVALKDYEWQSAGAGACAAQVALGTAGLCSTDQCSLEQAVEHIDTLSRECSISTSFGADAEGQRRLAATQRRLAELALRIVQVAQPPRSLGASEQTRLAAEILFDAIRLVYEGSLGFPAPSVLGEDRIYTTLTDVEAVVLAALAEDYDVMVAEAATLIADLLKNEPKKAQDALKPLNVAAERVTPVISVLVSNSKNLEQAALYPEQAAALRDARKANIEALIEASTKRDGRDGQVVVTLGTGVGLVFGEGVIGELDEESSWSSVFAPGVWTEEGTDEVPPALLSMPLGVGVQGLPPWKPDGKWGFGFHGQLNMIDLGRFLPRDTDEYEWRDFLYLGLQGGLLIGNARDPFLLWAELALSPYDELGRTTTLSFGLSYYVPFFDLN